MKTPSRALKQSQQALTERRIPMPKILAELASEGSKSLPTLIRLKGESFPHINLI